MKDIRIIQKYRFTAGDAISYYDAKFIKNPTLDDFVQWLITNNSDEWGTVRTESTIGAPIVEYKRGRVTMFCEDYESLKNKTISLTMKFGGWGMMDYVIEFL